MVDTAAISTLAAVTFCNVTFCDVTFCDVTFCNVTFCDVNGGGSAGESNTCNVSETLARKYLKEQRLVVDGCRAATCG
ncbi:MAG: hypothetical protein EXR77_13550 [Myxococcales bacterium]|nr:hypothetical protein [Myxococcales bacterium]